MSGWRGFGVGAGVGVAVVDAWTRDVFGWAFGIGDGTFSLCADLDGSR